MNTGSAQETLFYHETRVIPSPTLQCVVYLFCFGNVFRYALMTLSQIGQKLTGKFMRGNEARVAKRDETGVDCFVFLFSGFSLGS